MDYKVSDIACGDSHSIILSGIFYNWSNIKDQGNVLVFGNGKKGQIGRGEHIESSASYRTKPLHVDSLQKQNIKSLYISAGGSHSLVYGIKV